MEIREMTNKLKVSLNLGGTNPDQVKEEKKDAETKEEHTPVRINVDDTFEFEQVIETALKTTNDLCNEVNNFFNPCFSDYEGCIIEPTMDPNNPFRLRLFFTYKGEDGDGVRVLDKVGLNKGETAYDRLTNFNIMQKNKVYNLTQSAKEALEEFIVVPQGKKVDWNKVCVEFSDGNASYGRGQRFYMAITIDLVRFIRKAYGTKDADGGRLEYQLINIRPLGNLNTGNFQQAYIQGNMQQLSSTVVPNFLIGIMKLNSENLKDIAGKLGWIPQDAIGFAMVKA